MAELKADCQSVVKIRGPETWSRLSNEGIGQGQSIRGGPGLKGWWGSLLNLGLVSVKYKKCARLFQSAGPLDL